MKISLGASLALITVLFMTTLYLARPVVSAADTFAVSVKASLAVPLADTVLSNVSLEGPAVGVVGVTYTFTATVSPAEATQPITYLWEAAGQADVEQVAGLSTTTSFTWAEAGSYSLTVTAENGAGAAVQAGQTALIQQPPLDVAMVLDISGSMDYETSCFGCWTPYPPSHPNYNVITNPYPLNGNFSPLTRADNTNLCTGTPAYVTDTQSRRYLVHEAEYYSNEGPASQGWRFDQRIPGRGYWALQKQGGFGSNSAYIRAHPLATYSQTSLDDYPQLQGAAYNDECFSTGICWKLRAEQLGESTPTLAEVPYVEYDFIPQWTEPTYIWVRAVGGSGYSFEWYGQSPGEVAGGVLLPWRESLYWQISSGAFSSTVGGGPWDNLNSYNTSGGDGVQSNNDWRWIKLGSVQLTNGQQATLRLYQGSTGFNLDKVVFTNNSGGSIGDAIPNSGSRIGSGTVNTTYSALISILQTNSGRGPNTTAGSATRESCNICNPAYGQTVSSGQCRCPANRTEAIGTEYGTGQGCTIVPPGDPTNQLTNDLFSDIQPLRAEKQAVRQLAELLYTHLDQLGFVVFNTAVDNNYREKLQCLRYVQQLPGQPEGYCYDPVTTPLSYTNIIRAFEATDNAGNTNIAQGLVEGLEELGVNTPYNTGITSDCVLGSLGNGLNRGSNNKRPCDRRGAAGRVLILMTDGSPNEPDSVTYCPQGSLPASATWQGTGGSTVAYNCSIFYAQQAAANHVALYTIGIGAGINADLLEAMATGVDPSTGHVYFEGGCGRFFNATQLSDLEAYIPEIVTSARSCVPSLSLSKSGPAAILAGESLTYTLTLTNTGALLLSNLVITDVIPTGATYLSGGTNTGGVVNWTLDNLAVGETAQVTFAVTTTTAITNSDYRASGNGVNVKGTPSVFTEILLPNLEISKLGPDAALVDQPITYTLIVTNSGLATATNLVITDVIPAGATYLGGGVQVGEVVNWTVSSLGIGETGQFTFAVTARQAITNSDYGVSAEGGFTAAGHNTVSTYVSAVPEPLLSLSKAGPATAIAGQLITYTLTITNSGLTTATNLVITDALPTGASYVSGGVKVGNVISWTLGSLGLGETAQVTFVVTATHAITNSAYGVKASGGFSASGAPSIFTAVSPAPKPLLAIGKHGPALVASGAPLTYTLIVTNTGTAIATNLVITDAIPVGGTYVSGGTRIGNVVSWTVSSLAANGGVIQKSFVVTATQTITNSSYGVRADGGYQAKGLAPVKTLVEAKEEDKIETYLPLIIKSLAE